MSTRVVNVGLFPVDATGNVIIKNSKSTTIGTMSASTSTQHRVIPDSTVPNSTGYPTIKDYLVLEDAGGWLFKHMDQSFIITQK